MEIPSVVVRALSNRAAQQIGTATMATVAGGAITQTFDKTSKNICACLDRIDRTLIDGFAGRDIESERLKEALDGVKADIVKTMTDLEDATTALEKAQSRSSDFAGVGEFAKKNSAQVELRRLQEMQKALEEQLAARARALEAERAPRTVQQGEGAQSEIAPPDLAQALASLQETFTTLAKTRSETYQSFVIGGSTP